MTALNTLSVIQIDPPANWPDGPEAAVVHVIVPVIDSTLQASVAAAEARAGEMIDALDVDSIGGLPAALADKLPLAGGTVTGPIGLPGDPANDLDAAPKQYIDQSLNSGALKLMLPGTGAVAIPAIHRWRDWITPEERGAAGNDAALDWQAMMRCIETAKHVILPPGPDLLVNGEAFSTFAPGQIIRSEGGALKKTMTASNPPIFAPGPGTKGLSLVNLILAGNNTNSRVFGVYTHGTAENPVDGLRIIGCTFNRPGESAAQGGGNNNIFLGLYTRDVVIYDNDIRYGLCGVATGGDPLGLAGVVSSTVDGPVQRVWIDKNRFYDIDEEAVDINWDTQQFWITNNYGERIGRRGTGAGEMLDMGGSVDGTGSICSDGYVAGNIMTSADVSANTNPAAREPSSGVHVKQYSKRIIVEANILTSGKAQAATTAGAKMAWAQQGCEIRHNEFYGFERGGYFSSPSQDCGMHHNLFDQVMDGVAFLDQGSNLYVNIDLRGNRIIGVAGATGNGIGIRDFDTVDISGARIEGFLSTSSGFGRGVIAGADGSGTDLTCDDVQVKNCNAGIVVASARSRVSRCKVKDVTAHGIQLAGPDGTLHGNDVLRASLTTGSYAYSITAAAARSTITNNGADDDQGSPTQRGFLFDAAGVDGLAINGNKVKRFIGSRVGNLHLLTNLSWGWNDFGQLGKTTIATDADATLTPFTTKELVAHTGTLTADRALTLTATNAPIGFEYLIKRTGSGAFNLSVGGLKNLATNTWCRVRVTSASTFELVGYGSL